jgi:membrane-bound serine protease (ClpP class)
MQAWEALSQRLFDPTSAYLFFVLGLLAVFVEVVHPGALVPGVTGLLSLSLAVAGFSVLPVNLVGVVLIVASVAFMAVDVKAFGHGGLTLVGGAGLVLGSLVLYSPAATVAPAVLACVAVVGLLAGLVLTFTARSVRRLPPVNDLDRLVGARGVVRTALEPGGLVQVNGQLWSAQVRAGQLEPGHAIRVRARQGLVLEVESTTFSGAATYKGSPRVFQ